MRSDTRPPKVGNWTEPALRVLRERYLTRKGEEVVETPEEMCWRVAQCLAQAEERWGKSPGAVQEIATAFYDLMVDGFVLPNSPTLMNAGKGNQLQYSACYVLPVGDSMEEIFDAVKAAAIIHKCLIGDTLVISNGLTRLREVQPGSLVMTDEGAFHVSALYDNGEQAVLEVRTHRGYSIVGTPEHRLVAVAPDGSYRWRKIGELAEGDWLVMKPGGWIGGETKLPQFTFVQKTGRNATSFKAREHELPRELTPELAELIGLYLGDGSNHRDGIRFTVGADSPDVVERIRDLSRRLFGKTATVSRYAKKSASEVSILSRQLKEWFSFLGITKVSSREAQIPDVILRSTEEVAYAFVRGLFTADGCVRENGHITLTTSSPRLAEELQIMLLALGVPTQRRRDVSAGGYESWQISVCTKAGFRVFRAKIGFACERKAARLAAVHDDEIFVKGETIPNQRWRLRTWYDGLPAESRHSAKIVFDDLLNRVSAPRELSRQRLMAVMKRGVPFPPFFEELATEDFFFVRVTEIRDGGVRPVYDLTIPEKHAYLANGFASHNSGGGTGFAFSRLRPKDDLVTSTGGKASGPISFLRVFNSATEAVKQGGCVAPDTRVSTNRGVVKINALGPADATPDSWLFHQGGRLFVATDEGPKESDEFYNHGVAPVRRVRTRHGFSLCATLEHRLRVIDEDGKYVWKALEDIKIGDWVALQKNTYLPAEGFKFPPFELRPHPNVTPVRIPEAPTEELGEFVGYFIGDGAVSINEGGTGRLILTVSQAEPDVAARLLEIGERLFGLRPVRQAKPDDASENYFFNSTTLVSWLKSVGVEKTSALDVRLPEIGFCAGPEFARGLLRGVFTADGTVSRGGYPSLSSTSKTLIEDVQQLLLALGVPSSISMTTNRRGAFGRHPLYRLRVITRDGLRVFGEEIGFFSSAKASRLQRGLEKAWEFNDVIPFQGELLRTLYGGPGRGSGPGRSPRGANRTLYRALQHYFPRVAAPRHLTRSRLQRLAEKHPEVAAHPTLSWFLSNNQFYDQVVKIEEGESLALDLSVPANNTYVANGFVSHNTRRGANMGILKVDHPDILEFIDCKLDGGITNFNISVAATDRFMEALSRGEEYELINPHTGKVTGTLSAREVFDRVVRAAWRTGDPGMVFLDRINKSPANPTPEVGMVEATNPCVTGDTLVATPTGWRRAEVIRPGDLIMTVKGPRPVERVETYQNTPTLHVRFSDGGTVRVTAGHQFYVYREGIGFAPIRLDRCHLGDEVPTVHEGVPGTAKILSIEPAGIETTYDLYEPETDTWITEGYVSRGCGEQPLLPNEACNLGSLNVSKFAKRAANGEWTVDWEEVERAVRLSVRFLDDVIEMNPYPLPEINATVKSNRRIGLGVMGWADLLFIMGIPYDSQQALELAEQLMAFIKEKSHDQSAKLAEERGPFPNWSHSIYKSGRPMRNSTVTTIAPTGCVAADTRIATVRGLLPIRQLGDPSGRKWQPIALTVFTDTNLKSATQFFVNGRSPVITLKTAHGYSLTATPNHRIRVVDPVAGYAWRRLDAIRTGDHVALQRGFLAESARVPLEDEPSVHGNEKPISLSEHLTPELCEFLGLYFGDGCTKKRGLHITFGGNDLDTAEYVRVLVKSLFDIEAGAVEHYEGCFALTFNSTRLVRWLSRNGLLKPHSHEVRVPERIFQAGKECVKGFLRGLFSADGSVSRKQGTVTLGSVSETFIDDVQLLLLGVGVVSKKDSATNRRSAKGQRPLHRLTVLGRTDFAEISFLPGRKRDRLKELGADRGLMFRLPDAGALIAEVYPRIPRGRLKATLKQAKHRGTLSLKLLQALAVQCPDALSGTTLETFVGKSQFYDSVTALSMGEAATLDLSVPDNNTYIANGFVSHNTISMIAGCSSGIEPIFALAFEHRVKQPDGERVLTFVNETFEQIAKDQGFYSEALMQEVVRRGSLHGIPGVPEQGQRVFKTSHEIPYDWHVRHQAAFQKFTDNGVSKTINMPNSATEEDIASAYLLAWELGCLGITVFRDGCKGEQVLNVGLKGKKEVAAPAVAGGPAVIKPRPHSLTGATYRMQTPIGTAFITVNDTPDNEPFEVFVQVGKGGSDTMAVAEALGRLISLVLRLPSPLSPKRRLEEVISQLSRIGGGQPTGFGAAKVLSLPDALARVLAEHVGVAKPAEAEATAEGPKRIGDLCKECGQATFIYEEGCKKCLSCGYNEC